MKTSLAIAIAASLLSACAGSVTHYSMLQRTGSIRVEPAQQPGADYRVTILNDLDFGYDPDRLEDRRAAAGGVLRDQCTSVEIVLEQTIEGGRNMVGRSLRTYVIDVRCQRRPAS